MSDEYEVVAKGKLKLKTDSEIKKKKKKKNKEKDREKVRQTFEDSCETVQRTTKSGRQLTKAELAFKQMQEKMQTKRIHEKASMTHKERVEKFNEHLDSLTEHFDIPKVSWTK